MPGSHRPLVVVLDFDGTITTEDLGDALCSRYAPPEWHRFDDQYQRGELSLPDAQRLMWGLMRATRQEAVRGALVVGRLRDGLDALLAAAARVGAPVWIASGGFDFYIEALLAERIGHFERIYTNHIEFDGDRFIPEFPHAALACSRCAVCKGKVCALARETGARVLFAGDGHSDRCVLGGADRVAAVRGSMLSRWAIEQGIECVSFDRLDELVPIVEAMADAGQAARLTGGR